MAGDKVNFGMVGNYGTQGVAAASNVPPGRTLAAGWKDATNNLWLFGGFGILSGTPGFFNDLWKFDGTQWTWIAGHNQLNQRGVRGTQGVAAAANTPGARQGATSWRDINNNFWLYGGYGKDPNGNLGYFNDLWKFDGAHWTFVSGYITNSMQYYGPNGEIYEGAPGFYGVKGVGASTNAPSARYGATAWADNSKNTWLFGGFGVDANGQIGKLNDLWKFDGSTWVWLSGANTRDQVGSYGAKGSAISTNTPGARVGHVSWMDATNNFWIFGGYTDNLGGIKKMNDLWKFDGANWIWVSGSSTENAIPVYGTQGVGAPANTPGARSDAIAWTDSSNVLWLFSGEGRNSLGQFGALYDMWNFDGTNWIWVLGTDAIFPYSGWSDDLKGIYGTLGRPDPANKASARDHAVAWADTTKHLWLFGGRGFDSNGNIGFQNDLWKFKY